MPLGDSITDGVGSSGGGYRVNLFHRALDAGLNLTFVGSGANGPAMVDGVAFPQEHEGHSGYTIDTGGGREGITPLIVQAMTDHTPDIILLMIGTNDVDIQLDLANAPARLGTLIDLIFTTKPDVMLVLAQIVPTTDDTENMRVQTYNAAMSALVSTRVAQGKRIVLVDMYGAFTANAGYKAAYMSDGLHPNDDGYVVMASVWFPAIVNVLH
jgi:lysophospholipase L1-like esterase